MKRKIKIEEHGDSYAKGGTMPKVRLKGRWLQAAGFNPGAHIELTVISPGVIELRVCGPVQLKAEDFTTATAQPVKVSQAARRSWAKKAQVAA
jgi:hypothetical protein